MVKYLAQYGTRKYAVISCLALAVLSAACAGNATTKPTILKKEPYKLYAILGLTGSEAPLGTEESQALKAAETTVNHTGGIDGHPLKIVIENNQSEPSLAVSLATPLLSKVQVFINGSVGATDSAVDALIGNNGPVDYDLSPVYQPKKGSYIFSSASSVPELWTASLNYLLAHGVQRIAMVATTDTTGQSTEKVLLSLLAQPKYSSLKVVANQMFADNAVTVSTQMAIIAAAKPQAILALTTGLPLGTVLRGMKALDLDNLPVYTTSGNATYAEMHAFASILPKYLYCSAQEFQAGTSQLSGKALTVTKQFLKAMGGKADSGDQLAWDPAMVIVSALRHLGVAAKARQIHSYIEHLTNFQGVGGVMNFEDGNQRGLGLSAVRVILWKPSIGTWIGVSGPGGVGPAQRAS